MTGPTVSEERLMELGSRRVATTPLVWRSNGPMLSLVFFALTCAAIAASWGFLALLFDEAKGTSWLIAVAALVSGEFLIRRRRFFGTGVESALWLGGLFAIIFGLPGEGSVEVLLLFAAASAIAGFRMRNALYGALAVVFVLSYLESRNLGAMAAAAGIGVATIALIALARRWQRPSTEMLWIALLVISPVAAAIAALDHLSVSWSAPFAALSATALVAALTLRHHGALVAAAVNLVIATAILEAHDVLPFERQWRLMIGGAVLLMVSGLVTRLLRNRTGGIVVTPEALTRFDEELQIVGTISLQPRGEAELAEDRGGRFGGAGATGDY